MGARSISHTDDGRYLIIDGRRWRATRPDLDEGEKQRLVRLLMKARRDVKAAKDDGDDDALARARRRVHRYKVALGERGPKWWEDPPKKNKKKKKKKTAKKKPA